MQETREPPAVPSREICRAALPTKSDKQCQGTAEMKHHLIIKATERLAQAFSPQRDYLVDHDLRRFLEAVVGGRRDRQTKKRCIDKCTADQANNDAGVRVIEQVRLDHDGRTALAIVTGGRDQNDVTPLHDGSSSRSASLSITSSASRSPACMLARRDWRRASSTRSAARTSGTQICTGRRPAARSRLR